MLGLQGEEIHQSGAGWSPVYVEDSLAVMSIGFMLPNQDDAVIWRGPRKNSLIKQFLKASSIALPSWKPLRAISLERLDTEKEQTTLEAALGRSVCSGKAKKVRYIERSMHRAF